MSNDNVTEMAVRPIPESQFGLAEYKRVIFQAFPKAGISFEDTLKPKYWCHVATKLKSGDRIELLAEDMSWFAEVIVVNAGRLWAKVQTLRFEEIDANALSASDDSAFQVEWAGPSAKWRVKDGDKVLKSKFDNREQAEKWAKAHDSAVNQ